MSAKNPYNLVFGKKPGQLITRAVQSSEIIETFCSEAPSQQIFVISGVRGSGKTVFLTEISKQITDIPEWIVVELNPERPLLESLAAKLCSDNYLANVFKNARINLSFWGFGVEIGGVPQITDIELAIEKMMACIKKQGKRLLITIDEVSGTKEMRIFASAFQIFVRHDFPVYLLMTGLYENINSLQNEKNLTFLYRAPKIIMKPLNIRVMAERYKSTFKINDDDALKMARLTRGYSFAFQVLGYFTWVHNGKVDDAMEEYRQYLDDYVYEKIWSELSNFDKRICYGIAASKNGKISEIRALLQIETNAFNPYRKRLIKKGLINGDERGYVHFILPLFENFVLDNFNEC